MHKYLRHGLIEDLDTVRHIPLGRLLGVRVAATSLAWLGPILYLGLGLLLTLRAPAMAPAARLADGLNFMLAVLVARAAHALGHILGGRRVASPMDELLVTATRDANLYLGDQSRFAARVHLGRALGGPLLNLALAALAYESLPWLDLASPAWQSLVLRIAGINLIFGLGGFLPLPSVDGEVIWRELPKLLRGQER